MKDRTALGVQVAAARGCHVVLDRSYGFADADRTRLLDRTDLLPVGSITKSVTGALVRNLVQRGWIDETAAVARYLPASAHAARVTVAQLQSQTSGLADYNTPRGRDQLLGEADRPAVLARDILRYVDRSTPGARGRWQYSNTNYLLLGQVVAARTGQPLSRAYGSLFRRLALSPSEIRYGYDLKGISQNGYEFDGFSYRSAPADPVAWAAGAGGLSATARGLVDFDCAMFRGSAGPSAYAAAAGGARSYRWGWFVERGPFGDVELYHDGVNGGFRAFNVYVPTLHLAVAVISNTSTFNGSQLAHQIVARLTGKRVHMQRLVSDAQHTPPS